MGVLLLSIQVSFPQQGSKLRVAGEVSGYRGVIMGSQARGGMWSLKDSF